MAARTRLAKLTRPATAATYSRTRLFEELDKADAAPVVWVVGPPGSGKTTLIADYTATRRLPSLWYQVDRGNADIASFFFLPRAGDAAVAVEGGEVALSRRLVWLDAWAFEQSARNVQTLCGASDLENRKDEFLATAQEALALYRGPLLGTDVDAAWATAGRERYRARLVHLVSAVARAAEKMRWLEEMVDMCRRAFECEPLSDGLCRRLMSALAQVGRSAEGIEVFQAFCTTSQALQRAEPSVATLDLYKKILADFSRMQADRVEP